MKGENEAHWHEVRAIRLWENPLERVNNDILSFYGLLNIDIPLL
jgi:hypothetical protein